MSQEIELLSEIRDLLQVIAEPALAQRDAKRRTCLRGIVGNSAKRAQAVLLMDGTRTQAALVKQSGMDAGNPSRLVKGLGSAGLIATDQKHPKVLLRVPSTFFDRDNADE